MLSVCHNHACSCPCGCQLVLDCACSHADYFQGWCLECLAGHHPGVGREAVIQLKDARRFDPFSGNFKA